MRAGQAGVLRYRVLQVSWSKVREELSVIQEDPKNKIYIYFSSSSRQALKSILELKIRGTVAPKLETVRNF